MAIRDVYRRSCYSCHESGINGAPRTGDTAAWAPRMAKGLDTLVANAVNGYRAMPPRGLCFDCSEGQYEALIRYMAGVQSEPE
ncbi:c-type cytochrome [Microbulbifer magnicolonia]|uniref:c-type cytochrome n=1 Tax=Microbulbifer magnicolonia TaxID=3109744 RepID=UPI002B404C04|nr:c-type cytochrome [Microbulbifer sp. GG15]